MLMGKRTKIGLGVAIVAAVVGLSFFNLTHQGFESQIKGAKEFLADHGLPEDRLVVYGQRKTSLFDVIKNFIKYQRVVNQQRMFLLLDLSETNVTDLSGLEKLTNLEWLNLRQTQVRDLGPLKGLTNLGMLDLYRTSIADLSPLKGLTKLKQLNLSRTPVTDLSVLKGLTNLEWLNLTGTQVRDLSPLQGLTNLGALYLIGTPVTDFSPLNELTNLQHLYLSKTQVADSEIEELQKALPKLGINR